jgi:23S rRNA (adenine2503-C2)-methyltransferase
VTTLALIPQAGNRIQDNAFGGLPRDFTALGFTGSADTLFRNLQRPWLWSDGSPQLQRRARDFIGDKLHLPEIVSRDASEDGSTKCVLETRDGHRFEAIHMPRAIRNPRVTLCISSQIGCAMECDFCATGKMGLTRNLTTGEIVGQVLRLMHDLGPTKATQLNLVFMGMGEPLHNIRNVERAIAILCDPRGLGIPCHRITVSTCGLVAQIREMANWKIRPLLAVSLNGTEDEKRSEIMPVGRKYGLAELKTALLSWPYRRREKITLEYVLMDGMNDTVADAERLAEFTRDLSPLVNLIPMNAHPNSPYAPPAPEKIELFARTLMENGVLTVIRNNRGKDISGACGQLIQKPRSDLRISC